MARPISFPAIPHLHIDATDAAAARARAPALTRLDSRKLFADARELLIEHGDELYRLRWTRSGKLILTK